MDFVEFPKMPRLSREIVITEKIDGTNGQVCITGNGDMLIGSRTRWITPQNDNFGFAAWCYANRDELMKLGVGRHFGEWWGKGIQRGYGLNERRFSLFNVARWDDDSLRPVCCHVVPILYRGPFTTTAVECELHMLASQGSRAAPGFMNAEGVIVYHTAGNFAFKKTIEKDETPKSLAR